MITWREWRDNNFNPNEIIAYHGSSKKFKNFDFSYINSGTGDGGMYGPGFYFTEDKELAKVWNESGYLYKVKLSFKKPFVCRNDKDREYLSDLIKSDYREESGNKVNVHNMKKFFSLGFDSIVSLSEEWEMWENPEDPRNIEYHDQYVSFKRGQIKIISVEEY